MFTKTEWDAYEKIKKHFAEEDARSQAADWFASKCCLSDDAIEMIGDHFDEFFDYKDLADRFFKCHDCNVAENDMWRDIISDYVNEKIKTEGK